jgi:hypothetical protein
VVATVELIRPDDLLNLRVDTTNLRLDTTDAQHPVLVVDDPHRPAFLSIYFPPQTIAETAFFEASIVAPEGNPNANPARPPDPPPTPSFTGDPLPVPGTPGPHARTISELAHPSRLVFTVPADARIPFTLQGLTEWSGLALRVNPIAAIPPNPTDQQIAGAPDIREPAADETAIELPYRLWISPNQEVAWQHRAQPFTSHGRTELWHTRLALKPSRGSVVELSHGNPAPLRAIWSPDYHADKPPDVTALDDDLGLTAISKNDRHQIVVLTSAFHGYEVETQLGAVATPALATAVPATRPVDERFGFHFVGPYVPQPFEAERMMLSPLGGWLSSRGHWTPPYQVTEIFLPPPDLGKLFSFIGNIHLPAPQPAAAPSPEAAARAPVARLRHLTLKGYQLDLSEWVHRATQGRDHYVRIVYEGELQPGRFPAALIKVTERKFRDTPDGGIGAYLIQHMFIVVRDPVRTFADDVRGMPLKRIELTTRVTPDIAQPNIIPQTNRSFWVEVMTGATTRDRFRFHGVGKDAGGLPVDFTVPMMFVSISDVADAGKMQKVATEYNAKVNIPLRAAAVPGQKVTYAKPDPDPAKRTANTALITESLNFIIDAGGGPPQLLKAAVRIPQVQELLGSDLPTTIRLFKDYVAHDFDAASGVFAEIVKEDLSKFQPNDPGAALVADTLGVTFSSDKAGGFATPNLGVSTLTRGLGPLAGKVADAVTGTFDPASFFPKDGLARLFGAFDLADLLPTASLGQNAPQMHTTTQDFPDHKLVTTTIDWQPKVDVVDLGAAKFTPSDSTQFTVHGEIKKTVSLAGAAQAPTFVFSGQLTNFQVTILSSVAINFTSFGFTARSGAKPDVSVNLDPGKPLEFMGDLQFVEQLRQAIPPDLFGSGPSLDIAPTGIRAGFAFALPPITVGVFALKDVSLGAALTLPFLDGKPVFDFNVSERAHPFLLTVAIFGGGGFFHLQLDTAGMKELEAALEFGAAAALDIGVASGEVHVMAGIYFSLQRKDPNNELQATLAGYIRLGGSLSVLGIVRISVEFNLTFAYQDKGKAFGRATLTVEVEVAFFHTSVDLTVERTFGGDNGDPKFVDFFNTAPTWNEYAEAFA